MATPAPAAVIAPADHHHAVKTLNELLAFSLMVSRDAPDRGLGHRFDREAITVLKTAEQPLFPFSAPKLVEREVTLTPGLYG